jgi:hypothetical protein
MDLHISVISDIKNILESKGHEVVNWSLSGHSWVLGKQPENVEIINSSSWRDIDPIMINKFCNRYGKFLSEFDGFIVAYPVCFAMIYERFNKPIIVVNCMRYDHPFCKRSKRGMLNELHACLRRLNQSNKLIMVANNIGDAEYFRMGNPSIPITHVPSLCRYTGMKWQGATVYDKFLVYSNESIVPDHPLIIKRSSLGAFKWDTLTRFRGIIHIPYETSTMSIFEHITAKIPLIFPTKRFLKELCLKQTIHFQSNYWKTLENEEVPTYLKLTESYDFWIEKADYYNIDGLYYFDSIPELLDMLSTFEDPRWLVRTDIIGHRETHVLAQWDELLFACQNTPPITVSTLA